jgi:hypothetical protein
MLVTYYNCAVYLKEGLPTPYGISRVSCVAQELITQGHLDYLHPSRAHILIQKLIICLEVIIYALINVMH